MMKRADKPCRRHLYLGHLLVAGEGENMAAIIKDDSSIWPNLRHSLLQGKVGLSKE